MFKSLIGNFWNTVDACFSVPAVGSVSQSMGIIGDAYEHTSIEPISFMDDYFISDTAGIDTDSSSFGFD